MAEVDRKGSQSSADMEEYHPGQTQANLQAGGGSEQISGKNWVIILFYVVAFGFLAFSFTGWFGEGDENTQHAIEDLYPTLVTPHYELFFWFWFPVGAACGVFAVMQFLPGLRSSSLLEAVAPFWAVSCALQIMWVIELGRFRLDEDGNFAGSVEFALICILISTGCDLMALMAMDLVVPSCWEIIFIRAPVALRSGWLLCLSALTMNLFAVIRGFEPASLVTIAAMTLITVFLITTLVCVVGRRPDPVFAVPVFWMGICIFIQSRNDAANELFKKLFPVLAGPIKDALAFAALQNSMGCLWIIIAAVLLRFGVACSYCNRIREVKEVAAATQSRNS